MNSETSLASPISTMALVKAAIAAGVTEGDEAAAQLATDSQAAAAAVIAKIPGIIQQSTKERRRLGIKRSYLRASLMPLAAEDSPELMQVTSTSFFADPKKLQNTGRIVFDHCEKAGLNPHIVSTKAPGDQYVSYSLWVGWELPADQATPALAQNRRWWLLYLA